MKLSKHLFLFALCIGCYSMSANAQDCADYFKKAEALRNSGDSNNYSEAIRYYQLAKNCDKNLTKDCDKKIKWCKEHVPVLDISTQEIRIPYQGGDSAIVVKSSMKWNIEGMTDWCNTDAYDSKNFIVQCREANNSTRSKETTLLVKSGSLFKTIKVIQEGRPEYIEVGAKNLNFPAKGTIDNVKIESNANWDVTSVPSWCKVEKQEDGIHIIVSPNDRIIERTDDIIIVTPKETKVIKIYQSAGDEHLTLSQNDITMSEYGDVHYVKVYTDAANWFVGDFPNWMNVQRVGNDSIRIECHRNEADNKSRSGSVQVRTDRQTAGIMVTQAPLPIQNIIFPESNLVSGRNISFGLSASYYMPFVSTSAGGDYVGSVLDYGLGTSAESASYKSAIGYSFGAFADIRLYKNIFLIAGVNFTQIKYKNEFNKNTILSVPLGSNKAYEYLKGEMQNSYTEEYSHNMIEVPILASYRFKVDNVSHIQLNIGPVLNYGLSAKMKLSGNSDCSTMHKYSTITNQITDNGNYVRHTAVNAEFNLYQPCVQWTEIYTLGNDAPVDNHNKFQSSPLKKFNCGLRAGVSYEWAGISLGITYTHMLSNMANKNYWENERWTVLNVSDQTMKGYKHGINTLEVKLAYTLRYLNYKKNKK